jgi:hypothetical protein
MERLDIFPARLPSFDALDDAELAEATTPAGIVALSAGRAASGSMRPPGPARDRVASFTTSTAESVRDPPIDPNSARNTLRSHVRNRGSLHEA